MTNCKWFILIKFLWCTARILRITLQISYWDILVLVFAEMFLFVPNKYIYWNTCNCIYKTKFAMLLYLLEVSRLLNCHVTSLNPSCFPRVKACNWRRHSVTFVWAEISSSAMWGGCKISEHHVEQHSFRYITIHKFYSLQYRGNTKILKVSLNLICKQNTFIRSSNFFQYDKR